MREEGTCSRVTTRHWAQDAMWVHWYLQVTNKNGGYFNQSFIVGPPVGMECDVICWDIESTNTNNIIFGVV